MCRLLFTKSNKDFYIYTHLKQFAMIAKNSSVYQGHGWGCSFIVKNNWFHYKNITPIWKDNLKQFGKTSRLIVHARSAFEDKNIQVENNMPFYDDKYIFVFNGELRGVKIRAEGRIGAEKIFNFIKRFDCNGMSEALYKGVNIISKRSNYVRAMNIIIAEKDRVYCSSLFNEDEEYFQMYYKLKDDKLIICSEVYPNETDWNKIENKSNGVFI